MDKTSPPVLLIVATVAAILSFHSNNNNQKFHQNIADTTPLTIKAKNYFGKNVVSTVGVIRFTTGLENDFYYADSMGKTAHFYVEARLAKFSSDNVKRIPLNISIVID